MTGDDDHLIKNIYKGTSSWLVVVTKKNKHHEEIMAVMLDRA